MRNANGVENQKSEHDTICEITRATTSCVISTVRRTSVGQKINPTSLDTNPFWKPDMVPLRFTKSECTPL